MTKVLLMVIAAALLSGCDDSKPPSKYILKEVIDVGGLCWENHVGKKDRYIGQVVRWQDVDTKEISIYGFLSRPFVVERVLEEVKNQTVYHLPFMISFKTIDADTSEAHWIIHGVSDYGENTQGYDSTCEVDVTKRGTSAADIHAPGIKK